jgi:hypothetical protein
MWRRMQSNGPLKPGCSVRIEGKPLELLGGPSIIARRNPQTKLKLTSEAKKLTAINELGAYRREPATIGCARFATAQGR